MTLSRPLIPPLPPGVEPTSPMILHWRVQRLETIAEHHHETKMDRPHFEPRSWGPVILCALSILLGVTGHVSPETLQSVLKLFLH